MDVELRTARLTLRQPRPSDAARTARLLNNFQVAGNLARVPYPYCEADALAWLATGGPTSRLARPVSPSISPATA